MLTSFANQSWERRRYPLVDDEFDLDATPAKLTIQGCTIQPGAPVEVLQGREARLIAWTIYQPPGADVVGTDFGWLGGNLYRVSGDPQRWTGPSALTSHDVVLLERWMG